MPRRILPTARAAVGILAYLATLGPPTHAAEAAIGCAEPVYDFGTVEAGSKVRHAFILTNSGDRTVKLKGIHAPCVCTIAQLSGREVPPGGSVEITAELDLAGRNGQQRKSIYIETDDPSARTLVLTLLGTVGTAMEVKPPYLVLRRAGNAPAAEGQVTIRDPQGTPFEILSAESSPANLQIQTTRQGNAWILRATAASDLPPGQHRTQVTLQTTHTSKKQLVVEALIIVSAEVVVAPSKLELPMAQGTTLSRTLIVRSDAARDLTIESVETPVPEMTTQTEPIGAGSFRITVANIRPAPALNGQSIRIRTGGSEPRVLDIPLSVAPTHEEL